MEVENGVIFPQLTKVKIQSLYGINSLMWLPNKETRSDNIKQIVCTLRDAFNYLGEYDTHYIREFLKIYNSVDNELDSRIHDLKLQSIQDANESFYIDKKAYNRLINPKYNNEVRQRAIEQLKQEKYDKYIQKRYTEYNDDIFKADINTLLKLCEYLSIKPSNSKEGICKQIIVELIERYGYFGEYNIEYIYEVVQMFATAFFDDEEGTKADLKIRILQTDNIDNTIDVEGYKYYMDAEAYQLLHDEQYLKDVDKLAPEEFRLNNDLENYNYQQEIHEQNNFLTHKETMSAQPPQRRPIKQLPEYIRQSGSHKKVGMDELTNIVLNLQRDFKRVAGALSVQGAQAIVNKHNATSKPSAHWRVQHEDINGDNIPDIVIRNSKNEPVVVNGWTTKRSDYPTRYMYYNTYPTREDRKGHPYPDFKRDELHQVKYDDTSIDVHKRGNVESYNEQAYPANWQLGSYNVPKPKRLGAYQRFQRYILKDRLDYIIHYFQEQNLIPQQFGNKVTVIAKVTGLLWNKWILQHVAASYGKNINDQDFVKYKNKKEGKAEIDNTVTMFYYHLNETSNDWTEEKRNSLENEFDQDIADTLERVLTNQEEINEHHYAQFTQQPHNAHNAETEGDFGEW